MQRSWKQFIAALGAMVVAQLGFGIGGADAIPADLTKKAFATSSRDVEIASIVAPFGVPTTVFYRIELDVHALPSGDCIRVSDTMGTDTRNFGCVTQDTEFNYEVVIRPTACGQYDLINVVTAQHMWDGGSKPGDIVTAQVTVSVTVPVEGCTPPPPTGCTLTQGYWKTHSLFGPAPYDDTWLQIGENTPFFSSGRTYYQVLWTAPQGNVYYILAHQFIAAKLNGLNGASLSTVGAAMTFAETFFSTYGPSSTLSNAVRNNARAAATTLDNYNNGLIGPGHCD